MAPTAVPCTEMHSIESVPCGMSGAELEARLPLISMFKFIGHEINIIFICSVYVEVHLRNCSVN